jgi:RNA polymerase sigma-70 factor, ECF subfamily
MSDRLRQAADALNEAIANRHEGRRSASLVGVLRAARSGDEDAVGELWHRLKPELLGFYTILAPAAAEELAAEVWLQVVRGIGRFEGDDSAFLAWVFTIAYTKVVDWQRSPKKAGIESSNLSSSDDSAPARAASSRSVMALVAALPADHAEVIALRVVAGLEVGQVAAITGKRPRAVRVLTHRGAPPARRLPVDSALLLVVPAHAGKFDTRPTSPVRRPGPFAAGGFSGLWPGWARGGLLAVARAPDRPLVVSGLSRGAAGPWRPATMPGVAARTLPGGDVHTRLVGRAGRALLPGYPARPNAAAIDCSVSA